MSANTGAPEREPTASVILVALERTVERTRNVEKLVAEKTSSVTREEPLPDKKDADNIQSAYPPLFSRIRELTENINKSLDRIEDNMRRVELL